MPEITLKELQTIQNIENDHRNMITVLGTLYNYLMFVTTHPSYQNNVEARAVAERALELMEAKIVDVVE